MTGARRIAVVIPTHNGAATLADTLESIRRQTTPPAEVIVVDDGSSDDSVRVAEEHPLSPRVICLDGNHGVAFARNVGLREAASELIAFVDQDDLWMPDRLERVAAAFAEHPDWRALVTDEAVFAADEDREELAAMEHPFLPWVEHWRPRDKVLSLLDDLEGLLDAPADPRESPPAGSSPAASRSRRPTCSTASSRWRAAGSPAGFARPTTGSCCRP